MKNHLMKQNLAKLVTKESVLQALKKFETENPYHDKKMQYFMPYEELAEKTRRVTGWFLPEEHVFQKHAKSCKTNSQSC